MKLKKTIKTILTLSVLNVMFFPTVFAVKTTEAKADTEISSMVHIYNDLSELKKSGDKNGYLPENRKWQGLPSVAVTGKRIWVTLYSGGTKEPDPNGKNYTALLYSENGGQTWVDPYIVFDNPGKDSYMTVWASPEGKLFLYFIVKTDAKSYYMYEYYCSNPEAEDIKDVEWKGRRTEKGASSKPFVITNEEGKTEWVCFKNYELLCSVDNGGTWTPKGKITPHEETKPYLDTDEPSLYQKSNGDLVALFRIGNGALGGVQKFTSTDGGKTWSEGEFNLGEPYLSPGSKITSLSLSSGSIAICSHNNNTSVGGPYRNGLTLFLSENDGETWDKITLEETASSYPEMYEGKDGKIYVAYDRGRYTTNSVRLTIITEKEIKDGVYNDKLNHNIKVSGVGKTKDIVGTNLDSEITVKVGTKYGDVLALFPETVELYDESGKINYLNKSDFLCYDYKADKEGVYVFEPSSLPENLLDVHDIVKVNVKVKKESGSGCGSAVTGKYGAYAALTTILITLGGATKCLRKKRR